MHFALLLFTVLFAAIHWAGFLQDPRSLVSVIANTLPVVVLAATAPYRAGRHTDDRPRFSEAPSFN